MDAHTIYSLEYISSWHHCPGRFCYPLRQSPQTRWKNSDEYSLSFMQRDEYFPFFIRSTLEASLNWAAVAIDSYWRTNKAPQTKWTIFLWPELLSVLHHQNLGSSWATISSSCWCLGWNPPFPFPSALTWSLLCRNECCWRCRSWVHSYKRKFVKLKYNSPLVSFM